MYHRFFSSALNLLNRTGKNAYMSSGIILHLAAGTDRFAVFAKNLSACLISKKLTAGKRDVIYGNRWHRQSTAGNTDHGQ